MHAGPRPWQPRPGIRQSHTRRFRMTSRVAVLGAAGFAGALAAAIVERHPRLELTMVTARSDARRRLDHLYPRYRVRRELESYDADTVAERADAAIVAYPHGAAAPVVEDLRR